MPAYESLPPSMDPLTTRFPVETADGVWFMRVVQTAEGAGYQLMRGGKDAADPVTVAAFAPEEYVERVLPTPEGTVWVNRTVFTTGETSLLELDGSTGEILRELPFPAENGTITGLFDLPDGSLGISVMLPTMAQAVYALAADGTVGPLEAPVNDSGNYMLNVTFVGTRGCGLPEAKAWPTTRIPSSPSPPAPETGGSC